MTRPITLVGDGIENPWNAAVLLDVAALFDGDCLFRDRAGLQAGWQAAFPGRAPLALVEPERLAGEFGPVVAVDNLPGASEVYGFRLPDGLRPAVIVGNERRGIARDMRAVASQVVVIPMQSRSLNCLNVASAAAVALYYLSRGGGATMATSARPEQRRPELLLLGPADHVECGSAIRSAGAFGWRRLFIDDRAGVWFGADRATRTEGRAAARRARNPIHVIPSPADGRYAFDEVCVVTTGRGAPLGRANLAGGSRRLLAIPDAGHEGEDWQRLGRKVTFARLELPSDLTAPRYRLFASIVLAEAARQIGRRPPTAPRHPRREPFYDRALDLLAVATGETIDLAELSEY